MMESLAPFMPLLYLVLAIAGWLYGFWLLYVLVMGFYRAWLDKRLTPIAKALAFPAIVIGYVVDLLSNWTIAWYVFGESPKHWRELVTDRLTRYMNEPDTLNKLRAEWICSQLLDPFDPNGTHCSRMPQGPQA